MISVPSSIADLLGPIEGAEILTWDMREDPPRQDIELVVVPQFNAPRVKNLDQLGSLRAVITMTAGYEHVTPHLPPGIPLANAVGVHDSATAEMALALMLAAQRDIPEFVRSQDAGQWQKTDVTRSLADARVLLVGYGGVGRGIAARLVACEATVTAVASRAREGDELVDTVHAINDLDQLLPQADILALAVPLLPATRGLLDAQALSLLPDEALVVNVGRGGLIVTEALQAECASGRLRAALDVTDPEPLPEGHPLWSTPGVLISPHRGGASTAFPRRGAAYATEQIRTFIDTGTLEHVVATGGSGSTDTAGSTRAAGQETS